MRYVYKYELSPVDTQRVEMPGGAQLLGVQHQAGSIVLYAMVDPEITAIPRIFKIYGTGHPIKTAGSLAFVGTVLTHGDRLVWHIFEVMNGGEE